MIVGLRLALVVKAKRLSAYCDSQLVTSQFSGDYDARNERMYAYLKIVQDLAKKFQFFKLIKVPRGENVCADALAALGSQLRDQVQRAIPVHHIDEPSITLASTSLVAPVADVDTAIGMPIPPAHPENDWRASLIAYLSVGTLSHEKWAAND